MHVGRAPTRARTERVIRNSLLLLVVTLSAAAVQAADWRIAAEPHTVDGAVDILETVWIAELPPAGPYDRIRLHRYSGSAPSLAALLYLPGTNMNGQVAVASEDQDSGAVDQKSILSPFSERDSCLRDPKRLPN